MTQRSYHAPFCDMEGTGEMIENDSRGKNMVKGKDVLEIAIVLLIISLIPAAIAAPDITSWGNNKTNNITPTISIGDTIHFNATANETLSPWKWYVDDVINKSATSGTSDTFDYTFNAIKTYNCKSEWKQRK